MTAARPRSKRPRLAVLATALVMALQMGGDAMAQGRGRDRDRNDDRGSRGRGAWEQVQQRQSQAREPQRGREPQRSRGPERGRGPDSYGPPGQRAREEAPPRAYAPQSRRLDRGGYLPPESGARVEDPSRHRLREPPRGYGWVRMGDRYMMVDQRTGQIFDVVR